MRLATVAGINILSRHFSCCLEPALINRKEGNRREKEEEKENGEASARRSASFVLVLCFLSLDNAAGPASHTRTPTTDEDPNRPPSITPLHLHHLTAPSTECHYAPFDRWLLPVRACKETVRDIGTERRTGGTPCSGRCSFLASSLTVTPSLPTHLPISIREAGDP